MERKKIAVRTYMCSDAQDLANIYFNTIHQINCKDYTQEQVDAWAPKASLEVEGWSKKFARTNPLVAIVDGKVVGFAEFEPNGHIDCFYCHHEWIGYGIGSALMKAIQEVADHHNIPKIFAEVSITARPFFERQGFKVIVEQKVSIRGLELTNFKMEKQLHLC